MLTEKGTTLPAPTPGTPPLGAGARERTVRARIQCTASGFMTVLGSSVGEGG
jgi:hypothetical protein